MQNLSYTTTYLLSSYLLKLRYRSVLGNIDVYNSKTPNIGKNENHLGRMMLFILKERLRW